MIEKFSTNRVGIKRQINAYKAHRDKTNTLTYEQLSTKFRTSTEDIKAIEDLHMLLKADDREVEFYYVETDLFYGIVVQPTSYEWVNDKCVSVVSLIEQYKEFKRKSSKLSLLQRVLNLFRR